MKSRTFLAELMDNLQLFDTMGVKASKGRVFTFKNLSRIDFFLTSFNVHSRITLTKTHSYRISDHHPIEILISSKKVRGKGYWKANASLLENELFKESLHKEVSDAFKEAENMNLFCQWEFVKSQIRKSFTEESKKRSIKEKEKIKSLVAELETLEQSNADQQLISKAHGKIDEYYSEKASKSFFINKMKWYCEGEKSTRYFFSLEQKQRVSTYMSEVINEDTGQLLKQDGYFSKQKKQSLFYF